MIINGKNTNSYKKSTSKGLEYYQNLKQPSVETQQKMDELWEEEKQTERTHNGAGKSFEKPSISTSTMINDVMKKTAGNVLNTILPGSKPVLSATNAIVKQSTGEDIKPLKAVNTVTGALANLGTGVLKGSEALVDSGVSLVTDIKSRMADSQSKRLQDTYDQAFNEYVKDKNLSEEEQQQMYKQYKTAVDQEKLRIEQERNYDKAFGEEFVKKDLIGDKMNKPIQEFTEKQTYLPQQLANTIQTVGNMLPSVYLGGKAMGALGVTGQAANKTGKAIQTVTNMTPFVAQATGSAMEQALNEGAEFDKAYDYARMAGAMEGAIESLSGGIGGLAGNKILSSQLSKEVANKISKNLIGKYALKLADAGIDVAGEGFEEVLATFADPFLKQLTYDEQAELATNEEMMQSFWDGVLASMLLKGGQVGANKISQSINTNFETQKLSKMDTATQSQLEEVNNNVLEGETIDAKNKTTEEIKSELEKLIPMQKNDVSQATQNELNNMGNQIIPSEMQIAQNGNMEQTAQNDKVMNTLLGKNVENAQNPVQIKAEETLKSAQQAGMTDIDINKAKELNNLLQSNARLQFYDENNLPQGFSEEDMKKIKDANGLYSNGIIYINKDSENVVEKILGHELTHHLEITGSFNDLANAVLDSDVFYEYMKKKGFKNVQEFKQNLLKNDYSEEQLDNEMVARFVEDNLFSNQKSINRIARKNATLAEKIKNFISDLKAKVKGTAQEKQLMKIEDMYRKALEQARTQESNSNKQVAYSKNVLEDGTIYIKTAENNFLKPDGTKMTPREAYNSLVGTTLQFPDGQTATIVKNLPQKDMYNELYRRNPTYKNVQDIKAVNNTVNDNIVELLENSELTSTYPDFNNRHATQGIKNFDTRKVTFFDGKTAYDITFSIAELEDGSKVAYAKKFLEPNEDILTKIKKAETSSKSPVNPPSNNSINQNDSSVNTQYSLDKQNDTAGKEPAFSMPETDVKNYLEKNSMELRANGSLVANNLTDKQIKDLVKIYKANGYEDVSTDYLVGALQRGSAFIPREVADVFIEKQLGYKPQYDTTKIYEDAEGNKLTKEQVEFYKDSAVRDIRGRLIPVYHRTDSEFYTFDKNASARHGKKYGQGFYFSITPENYGNREMKVYLNAKEGEFKYVPKQGYYIVQEPNQIKDVTNTKPTSNPDIRFSKNPVEIAKNPPNPQTGLDKLQKSRRVKEGDTQSNFAKNVLNQNIFDEKFKDLALNDSNIRSYDRITNKETLQEANDAINEQGQKWVDRFLDKPNGEMKATDIAGGFILMNRYQQVGDYESMIRVAEKLRKAGTQQGQTIQMFSVLGRMTPEGMTYYAQKTLSEAYDEILKNKTQKWANEHADEFKLNEKDIEFIQRRVNQASRLPEGRDKYVLLGEIAARIQNKIPPESGQSMKALARISMLLNSKTMIRNILGNIVIVPNHIVSDFIGSAIDKNISKKTGVRTTGTFTMQALTGIKKGVYESFDDFRRGISTREIAGDRFEIGQGKSFNENHTGKFSVQRNKLNKALNGLDRVTGFLLETGDRPIYETWFINSLNNQMKLNNVKEPTAEMIEIATDEALQRTWQDNNTYTKAVNSVRKALNNFNIKGYGLGDMVMPFVKTPANLTKAVVDFSPLGAINAALKTTQFNKDIDKGTATSKQQREVVKAWSQVITGSLGMAIMTALANAGILSGGSDEDKDVRNFEQNVLGIKPYSIKIGDKTFTYDWAQPLGTTAAMITDTVNSLKNAKDTESKATAILNGLQSGASVLLDQSFVSGIRNLFEEDNLINALIETGFNEGAKFTPQFLSQIAQLQDDTARTSYVYNNIPQTAVNKIKAKIPGLRQTLEPSVDVLGREVKTDNSIFNILLNPTNTGKANSTKEAEEMYKVYKDTGDKATIAPVAPYYITVDKEKIILSPKQRTEYQKTTGQIALDSIDNLLKNNSYNKSKPEEKAEVLKEVYSYATAVAKSEVSDYEISTLYKDIQNSGANVADVLLAREIANSGGTSRSEQTEALVDSGYSKTQATKFLDWLNKTTNAIKKVDGEKVRKSNYLKNVF